MRLNQKYFLASFDLKPYAFVQLSICLISNVEISTCWKYYLVYKCMYGRVVMNINNFWNIFTPGWYSLCHACPNCRWDFVKANRIVSLWWNSCPVLLWTFEFWLNWWIKKPLFYPWFYPRNSKMMFFYECSLAIMVLPLC